MRRDSPIKSFGAKVGLPAIGGLAAGARLERIRGSQHFNGTRFVNPVASSAAGPSAGLMWDFVKGSPDRTPDAPFPIVTPRPEEMRVGAGEALRVTWLGHSTTLLEIDGHLIATDPVLGPRAAPVSWAGPKRFHPPPIQAEQLPPLDAIIVSHDHFDHLDYPTISKLASRDTRWITSLGVGAHLECWGVDPGRITELDWWETTEVGQVIITAAPARHFAGRGPTSNQMTFWSSWAIQGPKHSAWFSGDTGNWESAWEEIGDRFGGFDLSLIEIGAWNKAWGGVHLGPENAHRTHQLVRAKTMMPVHWGTFSLGLHAWDQPICHLLEIADKAGTELLSPMMGQTVHRESGVADFWKKRRNG